VAQGKGAGGCGVKFIVDECLSPGYVWDLVKRGYPDSVYPMNIGLRGARDDQIVTRAFAEDRVIITANGRDYRKLLAAMSIHPGAIIVQAVKRKQTWAQIEAALAFLELHPAPADYMINRIVEVSATDGVRPYLLASDTIV
jgi:predicted nuclease of predicted toxin-antitoxin system